MDRLIGTSLGIRSSLWEQRLYKDKCFRLHHSYDQKAGIWTG
jgi:hypothetical protein